MTAERQPEHERRSAEREARPSADDARLATASPADTTVASGRGLSRLPAHSTARPGRQAAVLQMQRRLGNASVQRHLAPMVQRRPATSVVTREVDEGVCPVCGQRGLGTCSGCGQAFQPSGEQTDTETMQRLPAATAPAEATALPGTEAPAMSVAELPGAANLEEGKSAAGQLPNERNANEPNRSARRRPSRRPAPAMSPAA